MEPTLNYCYDLIHYRPNNVRGNRKVFIVAALDILGFSNHVMTQYSKDYYDELYDEVFWVLCEMQSIENDFNDNITSLSARFFSDSMFILLPLDYNSHNKKDFESLLYTIASLVERALENGFLVRGGLCVGECCVNKSMMWGPGIIKSHFLEEKIANTGRIIIEKHDYQQLKKYLEYVFEDNAFNTYSRYFVLEDDGNFAFDSTKYILEILYADMEPPDALHCYRKHLSNVMENITYTSSSSNIKNHMSKLSWQIKRYNDFAQQLGQPTISVEKPS